MLLSRCSCRAQNDRTPHHGMPSPLRCSLGSAVETKLGLAADGGDVAVASSGSVDDLFEQFQEQEKDFLVAVGLAKPESADTADEP